MAQDLNGRFDGFIFDMDGVFYRGERPLPGARELLPALRTAGLSYILLTNNATLTPEDVARKLARMGVAAPPDAIVTSAGATAEYLREQHPEGGGVYVIGEAALVSMVSAVPGYRLDGWQPDYVVVGLDRQFNYDAMQRACSAIRRGANFIATNSDATLPVEAGELWPGAGSIIASIRTCCGVEPLVIGKPSVYMADMALKKLELSADRVLCVGDRLDTDILFGARAGLPTGLVLTGVSSRSDIPDAAAAPDHVFEDLPHMMQALGLA
jgi:4-nitrophenyl phosphatase